MPHACARTTALAIACLAAVVPSAATAAGIDFHQQSLELPGAPAALVPADLDGDGIRDLAVVVVYTDWDQIGIEETTEMDQVEGLVEVLTIVPVLLDRREIRAYLGRPEGGYEAAGEPIPLPLSVLTLEPGPPGVPVLALTDEGASALSFDRGSGALRFDPLIESPPVLAGTGTFLAGLELVADVTGDGVGDLLLPAPSGLAVHRGTGTGVEPERVSLVPLPGQDGGLDVTIDYPLPRLADLDGDGLPDLLFRIPDSLGARDGGSARRFAMRNLGGGRFGEAVALDGGEEEGDLDLVFVGRLGPRGPATAVYLESLDEEDVGLRQEMRQAREPEFRMHLRPFGADLAIAQRAAAVQPVVGYVADAWDGRDGDSDFTLPGGFQDLNGDGLLDMVSVTNDVSLWKAMAILATRRLTLDVGFHPWCQELPGGRFSRAPGPPLESRLTINLNDLDLRRRSLFAGDFDGDGRADFLQLGRARRIGIHRGRADCSYPSRPDTTLELRGEIRDLALVEARDLDGDGRADLAVTHPQRVDEPGVTPPVRIDLYLTRSTPAGGGR